MYRQFFEEAVERTKSFRLNCPRVEYSNKTLITPESLKKFPYALREAVGEIDIKEIVAQCISIHYRLSDVIADIFESPCYFTIGYIEAGNDRIYYQSESDLKAILNDGIRGASLDIHAWLTLPTMEIIDVSLPTSYAIINNKTEGIGGVIADHADNLRNGVKYKPMLVGEDFLRKSGGLIDFNPTTIVIDVP